MARQSNIFTSEGKVGQASFYKSSKRGYLLRQKGGVSAARIATDPKFANTRKNGVEFGRAGIGNKLLRAAFGTPLKNGSDGSVTRRLTKTFMKVVQADSAKNLGDRVILPANLSLLAGFDFNADAGLVATMGAPFTAAIDRVSGNCTLTVASFVPGEAVTPPKSATHYKIVAASAEVDFTNGKVISSNSQLSAVLPLDLNPTVALSLQAAVTPNSTLPLFFAVGIQFFIMINTNLNPVNNGKSNALQIASVSVV